MQDTIVGLVDEFWKWLGITLEQLDTDIEGDDVNITLQTPDSALIIGMHGKSLDSFCHILARLIEKKTNLFVHVHLEVNNYMKEKDERMFRFLDTKIGQVMSHGKDVRIESLSWYERKKAHNYIAEKHIEWLRTHSEGTPTARILLLSYTGKLLVNTPIRPPVPVGTPESETLSEDGVGI